MARSPIDPLDWQPGVVLALGAGLGAAIFYSLSDVPFHFDGGLAEMARLQMHGAMALAQYPKSLDVFRYLLALALPLGGAAVCLGLWAKGEVRAKLRARVVPGPEPRRGRAWLVALAVSAAGCAWFSFDRANFYAFNSIPGIGTWPLLSEEGTFLGWVEAIRHGAVYARDFRCEYGPLLVYPLAWAMKLFGPSVLVARGYTYALNLLAYAIAGAVLFTQLRRPGLFVGAAAAFAVVFEVFGFCAPHTTWLRPALGLLPLLLVDRLESRRGLVLAGVAGAAGLLFSQEAAVCALAAVAVAVVARGGWPLALRRLGSELGWLAVGVGLGLLPALAFFAAHGALGSLFTNLALYPRLFALGWGSLPFPDLKWVVANFGEGTGLVHWAVVAVYVVTGCRMLLKLRLGALDRRARFELSLWVFGVLLFRSALGRSDETHVLYAAQPAFLLVALAVDRAWVTLAPSSAPPARLKAALTLGVLLVCVGVVFAKTKRLTSNLAWAQSELLHPSRKWHLDPALAAEAARVPRAGVSLGTITDDTLALGRYLAERVPPGEPVWFFPNEATYYFLFDRPNPTAYSLAYEAITIDQREELINALERAKVRFVVYSPKTWRIDGIDESTAMPEVVDYLRTHFRPLETVGQVEVLERIAPAPAQP